VPEIYTELDRRDEDPEAILQDARETLAQLVPGWAPSDGALDDGMLAAVADEASTLYSLLRETADDMFADIGQQIFLVPTLDAMPARTTTTWTAREAAPPGGYELPAGTSIAISAPQGLIGFETIVDLTLAEGETVLGSVQIVATEDGPAGNGAIGSVQMDDPLAWVSEITVDAPAYGGEDAEDDEDYRDRVVRTIAGLSRSPILPADFERLALESTDVARCLVLDNYNADTDEDDEERTVSLFPIDQAGNPVGSGVKTEIKNRAEGRREQNWVVVVADPTYTDVDVEITVARTSSAVSPSALEDAVKSTLESGPLSPAWFGMPMGGDPMSDTSGWQKRGTLRRFELAAAADMVQGVEYVVSVEIAESGDAVVDADLALAGAAPLPRAATVTVTVVDAE
jgi:uncharacterized phage protein gp47/JayE